MARNPTHLLVVLALVGGCVTQADRSADIVESAAPATPTPAAPVREESDPERLALIAVVGRMLNEAMTRCWTYPSAPGRERLVVRVQARLDERGELLETPLVLAPAGPTDPGFEEAAQAAVRAVMLCAPYDFLPTERYEDWKLIELTFAPPPNAS